MQRGFTYREGVPITAASDAIVAPAFWLALFGLPGIAVYKAINTADSMNTLYNMSH